MHNYTVAFVVVVVVFNCWQMMKQLEPTLLLLIKFTEFSSQFRMACMHAASIRCADDTPLYSSFQGWIQGFIVGFPETGQVYLGY